MYSSSVPGRLDCCSAAQLSTFPEIVTRVVEKADGPLEVGRADGIACRTVEMFEAFGLAERLTSEAYWINENPLLGAGCR